MGADVVHRRLGAGAVTRDGIARMAEDAIVFALANPRSEIDPEEIEDLARRHCDGPVRLPEPDQQRARLPRRLPGALDVRASAITREMELAAAHALAGVIPSRPALRGLHHPQRLRPERRADHGARRGRGCASRPAWPESKPGPLGSGAMSVQSVIPHRVTRSGNPAASQATPIATPKGGGTSGRLPEPPRPPELDTIAARWQLALDSAERALIARGWLVLRFAARTASKRPGA